MCKGMLLYSELKQMSNQDNTLLDFLKKKSLFSYSPSKNAKRSRSKSQQSKLFSDKGNSDGYRRQLEGLNQKILNLNIPESAYSPDRRQRHTTSYVNEQFANQGSRSRNQHQSIITQNAYEPPRKKAELHLHDQRTNSKLWTGLISYGSNFESARVQSAHCLQALTNKLEAQINSISVRMEAFNSRIYRILMSELKAIQEMIYRVVEASFQESEKHVRQYMRKQQQMLACQLTKSKTILQKELLLIQTMKSQLHTTEWRKVAGQILSTNFENKIEGLINQSKDAKAGEWLLEGLAERHLKNIVDEIKLIFRLQT